MGRRAQQELEQGVQAPGHPMGARQRKMAAGGARVSKARGAGRLLLYWGQGPCLQPWPSPWAPLGVEKMPGQQPSHRRVWQQWPPGGQCPRWSCRVHRRAASPQPACLCPSRSPPEVPTWGTARFTALPLPIQSVLGHLSWLTPLGPVCSSVTEVASCPCPSFFPWADRQDPWGLLTGPPLVSSPPHPADGPPGTVRALRGLMSQETLDRLPSEP